MGIPRRIACAVASLLFFTNAKPVPAGVTVSPSDETSYSQQAGSAPSASIRLTNATLRVTGTEWIFSIKTETHGDLGLFHIYLDTDADASTGYQPPSRKSEALGADYLIEGSTLNVWDGGSNHAAWSWKHVGAVEVTRGMQGEIAVSVPLEQLRLKNFSHVRVLVETLTEKWESADTLPRQGVWDIDLAGVQRIETDLPFSTAASTSATTPRGLLDAGFVEQAGNPSARKSASLVRASASFEPDTLLVKATMEAEPDLTKFHVYIDTDLNASTGFHSASAVAGLGGADFLCEGEFLYAWDGAQDQTAWSWRKISPIKVTRGTQTELLIAIPLIPLNLHGRREIQLLVETIDDNWKGEDVIPRDRVWRVKLPAEKSGG
jgi:hypothetical protein